jgi:hypothetical protein
MGDPGFEPGTSSLSGASGGGSAWVVSGFRPHPSGFASLTRTAAGVIRAAEASTPLPFRRALDLRGPTRQHGRLLRDPRTGASPGRTSLHPPSAALWFEDMPSRETPPSEQAPKTCDVGGLQAGTIKRIHVNQHVIRRNAKTNDNLPPLSVKTSKGTIPCSGVVIHGAAEVRYSPDRPLACGARVWIETRAGISLRGSD